MGIDVLENPSTNPDGGESKGILDTVGGLIGNVLMGGAGLAGHAITGTGKYLWDTATAESNNVPYKVRLAVAGSRKGEDKLRTLRQFYPDAMPTNDGDFTFLDPETKKRVTLNDDGLSVGDIVGSVPDIGEMLGGTAGLVLGGAAGTAGGPLGTFGGGVVGSGLGAAAGSELGRQGSKYLASLLTGKDPIDTRGGVEVAEDFAKTGSLNSLFASTPLAGRGLRNSIVKDNLTDESAGLAQALMNKGYNPTLGQIGSDAGKVLNRRQVESGIIGKELQNQDVLNRNIDDFLGSGVSRANQNELANQLRSGRQGMLRAEKSNAGNLYDDVVFGDDVIDLSHSQKVIKDIYKNRGMVYDKRSKSYLMPEGVSPNPDFVFDASMERKINRIMSGQASEKELASFRSDVKTALRDQKLKYDTRGSLMGLDKSLTDDLVSGSPDITAADRAARSAWFKYKEDQGLSKDILGRAEGITDKTRVGQGVTEGQGLKNARNVFKNNEVGSDAEAAALSNVLSPQEKNTIMASLLRENPATRGAEKYLNPLEQLHANYNTGRISQNLVAPEQRAAFADLLEQSRGTTRIPPGMTDRSGFVTPEGIATLGATAVDPAAGAALGSTLNAAAGIPGSAGGSGQFWSTLVRNNPASRLYREAKSNISTNAAIHGELPSQLSYMPSSPLTAPATMAAGQAAFGNVANGPESNLRIPETAINEAVPKGVVPQFSADQPPVNLDDLLKDDGPSASSVNLDDFLKDDVPLNSGTIQSPNVSAPVAPEGQPKTEMTLDDYIDQKFNNQQSSNTSDLDTYMNDKNGLQDAIRARESSNNYGAVNTLGYLGAYQMGAPALEDLGLLKPGASRKGNAAVDDPNNWTIPGGKDAYLQNAELQDEMMEKFMNLNKQRLAEAGIIDENTPQDQVNGYLAAAHLGGVGGVKDLLRGKKKKDAYGTSTQEYYNLGMKA